MRNRTSIVSSIGIDLGDEVAYYACLDAEGNVVCEGQVKMTPARFRAEFGRFAPTRIALEAGAQSRWAARELAKLGHQVLVANPRQVRLIAASTNKSDPSDARLLARLARVDPTLLAPIQHRSDDMQQDLLLIRARAQLVKSRTGLLNCVRGMAKTFGVRIPRVTSEQFAPRLLEHLPEGLRLGLQGLVEMVVVLTGKIAEYDEQIEALARSRYPMVARLSRVPGVGTLTALTFVLTLGEPARFEKSRDVGGYFGLRPKQRQSGARDPQLGVTKAGDGYVRKLLVQSAHCVLRKYGPDTALKQWGLKLSERGGRNAKKRAIVAVARKLAVLLHRLWVSGEEYRAYPAAA